MKEACRHNSSDGEEAGGAAVTVGVAGTDGAVTVVTAGADIIAPTTAIARFMVRAITDRATGDSATGTPDTITDMSSRTAGMASVSACGNCAGLEAMRTRF